VREWISSQHKSIKSIIDKSPDLADCVCLLNNVAVGVENKAGSVAQPINLSNPASGHIVHVAGSISTTVHDRHQPIARIVAVADNAGVWIGNRFHLVRGRPCCHSRPIELVNGNSL